MDKVADVKISGFNVQLTQYLASLRKQISINTITQFCFCVKVFSSAHQLTVESNLHQLEPSYVWFEGEASGAWSVLPVFSCKWIW